MKSLTRSSIILTTVLAIASTWAAAQTPTPTDKTVKISGSAGLGGVAMRGFPGSVMSDENGHYSAQVPPGWSGTVTPFKEGFVFEPPSRTYSGIREDLGNVNYAASTITFTIAGNAGAPDVVMQGLPDNPMTDNKGNYNVHVPYRWSGRVAPVLDGYAFSPPTREYPPLLTDRLKQDYKPGVWTRSSQPVAGSAEVLIVPTKEVNTAEFAETAEDMRVMRQILREKTNEQRATTGRAVLPDYGPIFGPTGRGTEAIYIQGYGAMFVMEVGFPLARVPQSTAAGGQTQQQGGDPVWQQARQRLEGTGQDTPVEGANAFNPEQFKENMVRSLRHAANIRHLDANEWVILTLIGQNRFAVAAGVEYRGNSYGSTSSGGGSFNMQGGGSFSSSGGGYTSFSTSSGRTMTAESQSSGASAASSVLTIQAKKTDIDAFAGDKINFEQFNQRVKVFNY